MLPIQIDALTKCKVSIVIAKYLFVTVNAWLVIAFPASKLMPRVKDIHKDNGLFLTKEREDKIANKTSTVN